MERKTRTNGPAGVRPIPYAEGGAADGYARNASTVKSQTVKANGNSGRAEAAAESCRAAVAEKASDWGAASGLTNTDVTPIMRRELLLGSTDNRAAIQKTKVLNTRLIVRTFTKASSLEYDVPSNRWIAVSPTGLMI